LLAGNTITYLLGLQKQCLHSRIVIPPSGERGSFEVVSLDETEQFLLDVNRTGTIKLTRCSFQERYAVKEPLVRLDLDKSKPHRNPDDNVINGPHIHIYRTGYRDAWAYSLTEFPDYEFSDIDDITQTFIEFCDFCNIEITGTVQGSI
jgi:hypothetical protein